MAVTIEGPDGEEVTLPSHGPLYPTYDELLRRVHPERAIAQDLEEHLYGRDPESRVRELREAVLGEPQMQMVGLLEATKDVPKFWDGVETMFPGLEEAKAMVEPLTAKTLEEAHALLVANHGGFVP
jgi:hypothetical protein